MPEETTNEGNAPETVSKAEYEVAVKERDGLKESHKALQRSYENLRRSNADVSGIAKRQEADGKLLVSVAETLGKLGIEGVDTKPALDAYKKDREAVETVDGVKGAASEAIVAAFEAAGVDTDSFETTWSTDERFVKARTLFNAGKYTEAARESITVLSKPVAKAITEEAQKAAIEAAVAKDRQTRAAVVDSGSQTSSNGTTWAQVQKAKSISDISDETYEKLVARK